MLHVNMIILHVNISICCMLAVYLGCKGQNHATIMLQLKPNETFIQ